MTTVTTPLFFTPAWADAVRDALTAGPSPQARVGKLGEYWDFFDLIKSGYPASWALGCLDNADGRAPAYLFVQWGGGTVTECRIVGPDEPVLATYVLGMGYQDWKALHDGYDAQRTVMYRKIRLEEGDLLEFFKSIYFFVECLAVIGAVPAGYPQLRASAQRRQGARPRKGPKERSTCSLRASGSQGAVPMRRTTGSGSL
jgi:hypothetical protein